MHLKQMRSLYKCLALHDIITACIEDVLFSVNVTRLSTTKQNVYSVSHVHVTATHKNAVSKRLQYTSHSAFRGTLALTYGPT
jgi:hypothetical protein